MVRKLGVAGVVVMLVVSVLAAPSEARTVLPDLQCGLVTTNVKLRHDLTCVEGVFTELGSTAPIRIDLGGHSLTVPAPGIACTYRKNTGCAIRADGGPLTVVNGTINGGVGFPFNWDDTPPGGTLAHVTVNGDVSMDARHQEIRNSTVNGHIGGSGAENTVDRSTVHGSVFFGPGIWFGTEARVSRNTIVGGGIRFSTTTSEEVMGRGDVTDNVLLPPTFGISLDDGGGGLGEVNILRNQVLDSSGNGIELTHEYRASYAPWNQVTVGGNRVVGSAKHGIFLAADPDPTSDAVVVDRRNNVALDNALSPQCVGVVCGPDRRPIPVVTWPAPNPVGYGTPLGPEQLNATASVPGTFTYSPPAGSVLPTTARTISLRFVPDDSARYQIVDQSVPIRILRADPPIAWVAPSAIAFGTPLGDEQLDATSSVPGTFTYTPPAGTVLQPGDDQVLTAEFTPTDLTNYAKVTTNRTIDVLPVSGDAITWAPPADLPYGRRLGAAQLNATANLPGSFSYLPRAGTVLAPGTHELTVVFTPTDIAHHALLTATVTVNVLAAPPSPIAFSAPVTAPQVEIGGGVEAADLDGDGITDLVTASALLASDVLSVQLGRGDGTYEAPVTSPIGTGYELYDLRLGDLDGDGDLDVVVSRVARDLVTILLGSGDGTFGAAESHATGRRPGAASIADLDEDGFADLVVPNTAGMSMSVFFGAGGGTFADRVDVPTGLKPGLLATGDVNEDGHVDVAVPETASNAMSILLGAGDGTFPSRRSYSVGAGPTAVALHDVDGDGKVDMVVLDGIAQTLTVFRGDGSGGIINQAIYPTGRWLGRLFLSDLDLDGRMDVVATDGATVAVRLTLPGGVLGPQIDVSGGVRSSIAGVDATVGDFDADGRPDLIFLGGPDLAVAFNRPAR